MLSVERLVKCRTTSGSATSGSGGGLSASAFFGNNLSMPSAGTSHTGSVAARRPGLESSKRRVLVLRLRILKVFPGVHRVYLLRAFVSPSISPFVLLSVTVTRKQSSSSGYHLPS